MLDIKDLTTVLIGSRWHVGLLYAHRPFGLQGALRLSTRALVGRCRSRDESQLCPLYPGFSQLSRHQVSRPDFIPPPGRSPCLISYYDIRTFAELCSSFPIYIDPIILVNKKSNFPLTNSASHTQKCTSRSRYSSVPMAPNSSSLKQMRRTSCTFATTYNRFQSGEARVLEFWFARDLVAKGDRKK